MNEHGFFVGRMNPIHLGHERIIDHMVDEHGVENSTIILGSSNSGPSMRHFFNYSDRRQFIKTLYPEVHVVGLPDYSSGDDEWLTALDDLVATRTGLNDVGKARFFGGCDEDVEFFQRTGRKVTILNRFDRSGPKVSATEVRDALLKERSTEDMLNPKIAGDIAGLFSRNWEFFKRQ